jgi:hypothetical protein
MQDGACDQAHVPSRVCWIDPMTVRPYTEEFAAKLDEISRAFYACRLAFRSVADETEWRPREGSPAAQDTQRLAAREPPYPTGTASLLSLLPYFYLSAASEHLGALGALYREREVLIPPLALVRASVEHSARVLWLLQLGNEPVEDRLARAYLEMLLSSEEQKKTSGRLLGKESQGYRDSAAAFRRLREEARAVFGDPIADEDGRATLRGQQMPGLEECVAWMFGFVKSDPPAADLRGIYDYISNSSHPTMYTHIDMWEMADVDGSEQVVSQVTTEEHATRARIAVVPFYEALSCVMSYNGWPRDRHEELTTVLDELLPGVIGSDRTSRANP